MPRHPPCALINLTTKIWMLASTVQFSRYGRFLSMIAACPHEADRSTVNRPVRFGHPIPQDPTACLICASTFEPFHSAHGGCTRSSGFRSHPYQCSTHELYPLGAFDRGGLWTQLVRQMLLRKEVIQPHLPVRLPCYDFVPIASPTFDGSLPCGLGHRLRVLPTFVT